ncbi:MAG: T9SS type A sorting domain-containing protein [Fibrobacteres bacterium]|nr:T9SS type A sorting domain-containing protein [Fibrobacterota bacterium]
MKPSIIIPFLLLFNVVLLSQVNTWVKTTGRQVGKWEYPALAYSSATGEFVLTAGQQPTPSTYHVMNYSHALGKWINALPHDSLYGSAANANSVDSAAGKWADSTGTAYGYGYNKGIAGFGWRFGWRNVLGYLRPNTSSDAKAFRAYTQFCYNTDDGKIYFFVNNQTFTYDPATRRWDTLSTALHPNGTTTFNDSWNGNYFLKWGTLCYDGHNKELVLVGGGGIDKPQGSIGGTWTFNTTTKVWSKLSLTVQPKPRANTAMAYDPVRKKIVLFGGDHLDYLMNETWVYDCATRTWENKNPSNRPRPRAGHALLYLPKSGKIVMMGGYRYEANQTNEFEMWSYDVGTNVWVLNKRFTANEEWPRMGLSWTGFGGHAATDLGDTIIALTDSANSPYGYSPQTLRMAYDPSIVDNQGTLTYGTQRDTVGLRGGWTNPSWYTTGAAPDTNAAETALRSLAANTWTLITPPQTPGGDRTWGTAVFDPDRDLFMRWSGGHAAYCGTDVPHYSPNKNRWSLGYLPEGPLEYDGNNECNPGTITFNNRPFLSGHTRRCYAYDVNLKRMISVVNSHTYLYDPDKMDWDTTIHIHNAENYSADRGGGVFTTPHGAYGYFNAQSHLFSPDSLRWRKLPQTGTLPGFTIDMSGAVYDSKRDRMLHFFNTYGNSVNPVRTYEYDFKTATARQLFPADSQLAVGGASFRECIYLPGLDAVLFTIAKGSGHLLYNCANNQWTTITIGGINSAITNGVGPGLMFDQKRALVWLTSNASAVYALKITGVTTKSENEAAVTKADALVASPNPFNPAVGLTVYLKDSKGARLTIHDVSGRIVADLSSSLVKNKQIVWDAKQQAAGVYTAVLTHSGKKIVRQLILVR